MRKKCKNCKYFQDNSLWHINNLCGIYGLFGEPTNTYANEEDLKNHIMIPPKNEKTSAETCIHFRNK